MPSPEAHLSKADPDLKAYQAIPPEYPEWRAAALFYAAVHYVEALAVTERSPHVEHYARERWVRKQHRNIWAAFSRLKQESEKARYLTLRRYAVTADWEQGAFSLSAEQVDKQLYHGCIIQIRDYVRARVQSVPVVKL